MSELDSQPAADPDQTPPVQPDLIGDTPAPPQASQPAGGLAPPPPPSEPAGGFPPPPPPEKTSVLERLGSSPFARGKFPFLGILASIYEHVSEVTARRCNPRP